MSKLLDIAGLSVVLQHKKHKHTLVDDVSFALERGECLGILGESGSGKSMTCKSFLGLLDRHFDIQGQALFGGEDLLQMGKEQLRKLRGKEIGMIMQNPMTCFDPLERIGKQMCEGMLEHGLVTKKTQEEAALGVLESMQIRGGKEVLASYPHQLSGGMLQRIMIGLALFSQPKLLVADEPTTAIDSITQFEIMKEFVRIKKEVGCGMLFISHDLGVISKISDRVIVMHDAKVVQTGSLEEVIQKPANAYTKELILNKLKVMNVFSRVMEGGSVSDVTGSH